jgi:ribosomal protein S18 acetylase RimI-like enzyme
LNKKCVHPKPEELENIVAVDKEVIGNVSRRDYIKKAVEEEKCIVVKSENNIVGFLIYDVNFFRCSFISLIIVSPTERRKGFATSLIDYFLNISPSQKVFSSTNLSNKDMQIVFLSNGFIKSGFIYSIC